MPTDLPPKPSVPKFSSFTPKIQNTHNTREEKATDEDSLSRAKKRRRLAGQPKHHDDHELHHDVVVSRQEKPQNSHIPLPVRETKDGKSDNLPVPKSSLFAVDVSGDPSNLKYGCLHKYDVPTYRRTGGGRILGIPRGRIDKEASDYRSTVVVLDQGHEASTRSSLSSAGKASISKWKLVRRQHDTKAWTNQDFIGLSARREERQLSPVSNSSKPRREINRISIFSDTPIAEEQSSSESDDEFDFATPEKEILHGNSQLMMRTQVEPRNIQGWLDLIDHQRHVILADNRSHHIELAEGQQRSLAQIRLSIYERALEMTDSTDNERYKLWLGLLDQGRLVKDGKWLAEKWKAALEQSYRTPETWTARLHYMQQSSSPFRFEMIRNQYQSCLQSIAQAMLSVASEVGTAARLQLAMIHTFTRFTALLRDTGYHELAEGMWQAVLEFFCFCPATLSNASPATKLSAFEEFWDSELPRIGESGSKGWSSPADKIDVHENLENANLSAVPLRLPITQVASGEADATKRLFLSGKTLDAEVDDDPLHVVLFSDLESILRIMSSVVLPKKLIVQAFLCYQGLPPVNHPNVAGISYYWEDPFLQKMPIRSARAPPIMGVFSPFFTAVFDQQPVAIQAGAIMTTQLLFQEALTESATLDPLYVLRVLQRLVDVSPEDDLLAEYALALNLRYDPTTAEKRAKSLLKKRRSSLRLYNAYSLICYIRGQHVEASGVFHAVIGKHGRSQDAEASWLLTLRTWVWFDLVGRAGDNSAVHARLTCGLQRILCIAGDNDTTMSNTGSPTLLLKARRLLSEMRDSVLASAEPSMAATICELQMLIEYLVKEANLESALKIFDASVAWLTDSNLRQSRIHEELYQCATQLFVFHMAHMKTYRLSVIRERLKAGVSMFPHNGLLISAFVASESRLHIEDTIRPVLLDLLERSDGSISPHISRIWYEIERSRKRTFHSPAVRAAFKQAVEHETAKHSEPIWIAYLDYEISHGNFEHAKQVFFRGLAVIPWCKWFILHGISALGSHCTAMELRSVIELLDKHQLRMHQNLEDMLSD